MYSYLSNNQPLKNEIAEKLYSNLLYKMGQDFWTYVDANFQTQEVFCVHVINTVSTTGTGWCWRCSRVWSWGWTSCWPSCPSTVFTSGASLLSRYGSTISIRTDIRARKNYNKVQFESDTRLNPLHSATDIPEQICGTKKKN